MKRLIYYSGWLLPGILAKAILLLGGALICITCYANPKISIIIDDLGNNFYQDSRVAQLPGAVTCAVLPLTFYSKLIAQRCHTQQKTVMLHLPMQAIKPHSLGKGGLTSLMNQTEFEAIILQDLASMPYIVGINNHMGSLLTQRSDNMRWLMQIIKTRHLFFVDSRTSRYSVANSLAKEVGVPTIQRDIFLDNSIYYRQIDIQFQELIRIARQYGQAVGIGHPYPATLKYLEHAIPALAEQGVELVPVTELIASKLLTS